MKKTWKGINELIRPNSKSSSVNQIKHNNTLINEPKQIADTFNNFFANVGPEVDKQIPKTPISPFHYHSYITEYSKVSFSNLLATPK